MNRAYEKYGYINSGWNGEKYSIEKYLTNFDDFLVLLDVRRHLKKKYEIGNFYILNGKYWIDEFAQISKVTEGMDTLNDFEKIPLVMSDGEFHSLISRYNKSINAISTEEHRDLEWSEISKLHESGRPFGISVSRSMSASLPDRNTICPYCGKGWDLENIDDCLHHQSKWKDYPARSLDLYGDVLWDFVGQPLQKVWDFFEMKSNAIYYPMREHGISNPKWIDNTPDPEYKTMTINQNGTYGGRHGKVDENYIIQEGDSIHFQVVECYHTHCNRKKLNEQETTKFEECFKNAGFDSGGNYFVMQHIPNEYCHDIIHCTMCADWFNVNTRWGNIKIGWRKRVINIDWSGLKNPSKINGYELFKDEDTTKSNDSVHAWGWEKCTDYLTAIRETLEK